MAKITLAESLACPAVIDSAKFDATTEEDIRRFMIEDGFEPDDERLYENGVVVHPPHMIRERLGLSQAAFAELIDAPLASYRNWEQGRTAIPSYVRSLLNVIDREPEAALRALRLGRSTAA